MTDRAPDERRVPVLELRDVEVAFPVRSGLLSRRSTSVVRAVAGVSLDVHPGETVGLVGESGSGKTTLARTSIRLYEPTAGQVRFAGRDITDLDERSLRPLRREMQMVFQDPLSSLSPRQRLRQIIAEPMLVHGIGTAASRSERVDDLLETVGLSSADRDRYPHELSGGQRQRVGIARALSVEPKLVVCDEAVSALDVSVKGQILNLLARLRRRFDLTLLFVSHDLAVVRHVSDRVAVMYLGRLVEVAETDALYDTPFHPYTRALLSAVPVPHPATERARRRIVLEGDLPSPLTAPAGCAFHPRCPVRQSDSATTEQTLEEVAPGRWVACRHWRLNTTATPGPERPIEVTVRQGATEQ